MPAYITFH